MNLLKRIDAVLREIYINAKYPTTKEVFWGYDGENNSANLKIELPDYMVGEKFNYTAHFKDSRNQQTSATPTVSGNACSVILTSSQAVGGKLQVQVVGVSAKTPVATTYSIRAPKGSKKIRLVSGGSTITVAKTDARVISVVTVGNYETWSLKLKLNDGSYPIEATDGTAWNPTGDTLSVINEQIVKTPILTVVIKGKDGDLI